MHLCTSFRFYEKMHAFLSVNTYNATISQFSHSMFFYLLLKNTHFTVINILSVYLYICDQKKVSIRPRHHVYSSDSSSWRSEYRKQRGCINISRNSSVESKSSDQQLVLWTLQSSEMNVRIAHMAHVTIGLTSHAFIIDVIARCSLLHLWQETLYRAAATVETILLPFVKRFPRDFYETQEIVAEWSTVAWTFLNLQNADRSLVFIRLRNNCHKSHCKTPKSLPDIYEVFIENIVCKILEFCISLHRQAIQTLSYNFNKISKNNFLLLSHIIIISLESIILNVPCFFQRTEKLHIFAESC